MEDVNKRLCELLGCEPYETYSRLTGLYIEEYPDFADPSGRIDLLKRMMKNPDFVEHSGVFYYPPDHGFIEPDSLLISTKYMTDDNGALARAALEFLEKEASHE